MTQPEFCKKCSQPLEPWEAGLCEGCGQHTQDTPPDRLAGVFCGFCFEGMWAMATKTQYRVWNVGACEALTEWTDSKTEADIWCQECEEHETQPECQVVSREIDEYTVSVDDSRFLARRERVGGLSVWAIVEWRDDMPYATATTIESVGVSDEAPRARDVEYALSEIESMAYRERAAVELV